MQFASSRLLRNPGLMVLSDKLGGKSEASQQKNISLGQKAVKQDGGKVEDID